MSNGKTLTFQRTDDGGFVVVIDGEPSFHGKDFDRVVGMVVDLLTSDPPPRAPVDETPRPTLAG